MSVPDRDVLIDYTNYRGERRERHILPIRIDFIATEWHPEPQWLLLAMDLEIHNTRSFSIKDIHSWRPATA